MAGLRKKQRMTLLGVGMAALAGAAVLASVALNDSLTFFIAPSDLLAQEAAGETRADRRLRLGGLVEPDSIERGADAAVAFRVTDNAQSVPVTYQGVLPDLFNEGQGVVAEGYWRNGVFAADSILARHDEEYMPREVAEAIKDTGQWKGDE